MNLGEENESPWNDAPSSNSNTNPLDGGNDDAANGARGDGEAVKDAAASTSQTLDTPAAPKATVKSPGGRRKATQRYAPQPTKLEALDDDLGPLGPLGAASGPSQTTQEDDERPPELPHKEQQPAPAARQTRPAVASSSSHQDGPQPGPGAGQSQQAASGSAKDAPQKTAAPSISLEQAARPTFHIYVGDPHKVGDLTSSHTVYQIRTKTTSKAYRSQDFEVSRRYRDFLWLYNQLHTNNPGVIVPPPPEKQAVGRFESDFVEARRAAMERMLNKTASHPILQHDADLKIFLESEAFNVDVKHREKRDPDMPVESTGGMFSKLNLSVGSGTKFIEQDDWFLDRRLYLDTLETQLKALQKAVDMAVAQRKALAESSAELSVSLNTLAEVELAPSLTGPLASLSDLQLRIRDLYDRQAQQDVLTLGITIDEYIRLISSIKKAFDQRQRSWQHWHTADSDLQKRRSALDKLMRGGRSQQDKMSQLQADVGDAERRAHQAHLAFEDVGKGMRAELERFEKEKVEDFRMGLETYLESSVEAQKELIELWETYLMHLDADEEERRQQEQAQRVQATSQQQSSKTSERVQGNNNSASTQAQTSQAPSRQDADNAHDDRGDNDHDPDDSNKRDATDAAN